jgi:hypothetical protein
MVMTAGVGDDRDADGGSDDGETGLAADIEAGRSLVSGAAVELLVCLFWVSS